MADQDALFPDMEILGPVGEPLKPNGGNGRPRGVRNHKHKILEKLARAHQIPLLESVITAAIAGDMLAAKIVFDRIWPRPRTAPVELDLPATSTPGELKQAMHAILGRITSGELGPDEGAAIITAMKDIITAYAIDSRAPIATASGPVVEGDDAREMLAVELRKLLSAAPPAE